MPIPTALARRRLFAIAAPMLAAPLLPGPARAQGAGTAHDVILRTPLASRFAELIALAGLQGEFTVAGPISVFVPVNAAIDALPADMINRLRGDRSALQQLVRNHVTDFYSRLDMGGNLESGMTDEFRSKAGRSMSLRNAGGAPTINGVPIITANIAARNGILHGIGAVLPLI